MGRARRRRRRPGVAVTLISGLDVVDVRFPTSLELDGSDAMNPDPDYSAAYLVLRTDDGPDGFGLVFTIGRGNDVRPRRSGARSVRRRPRRGAVCADLGGFARELTWDSPALAGPREGGHAHGDRRRRQRRLGPGRSSRGPAGVGAPRGHDARGDRRARRLPLPHRRADAGGGARHPARRRARPGRAPRAAARRGVSGVHDLARAGSGTPTRSWCGWRRRPWPTGSGRSSSRSARISRTTCAG